MAGVAEVCAHFLEDRFHLMEVNIAGQRMAEKAVKDLAVLVIYDCLLVSRGN